MKVLVTGAAGFVGRAVVARLMGAGHSVMAAVRNADDAPAGTIACPIGDLAGPVDWRPALAGVDAVAHLAARVHVMREGAADPDAAFAAVNVAATRGLAEAAVAAGVRRFVFLSSVKVMGERTTVGRPFRDDDRPAPEDAYGRSKLAAEDLLLAMPGLEPLILRPPLVYGPGVRANLRALARLARSGLPLPFGRLANRRSLVGVSNLAQAIELGLTHPGAVGRRLLVADWHPTTAELAAALARAAHRPMRLLPVPVSLLRGAGLLLGRGAVARLTQPLEVAPDGLAGLGWRPAVPPADELAALMAALARE
ncbi:nucleoside-diphosphate-sugar epimerase [Stella humosa]|uniref:Nucleoside-diphosphate-sugar epimerase n=1 Tax=Stella humosa TaxID=94 RepID=A0A3N1KRY5_9PROT|nr:NAD-dependent epimerase/dehydratase family protein [Stella humosa]ROP80866.1 nucleoside-diphosphate-sugar epimerase [Stella humosa]BBK33341.1 UDP-glucose 4-epimerase [Stella humosa]